MTESNSRYDIGRLRSLLLAAFTPEELRSFCHDRVTFRPILDRLGPKHGLDDMVEEVITYCETYVLLGELLAAVREVNPRQYECCGPYHTPAQQQPNRQSSLSEPEFVAMRAEYLASLRRRFEYLDLGGIAPRVQNRTVKLRMKDIFVPLQAQPEMESDVGWQEWTEGIPPSAEGAEMARRVLAGGGRLSEMKPLDIPELLQNERAVILGDPGSGKSTLLRYAAYAVACGMAEKVGEEACERLPVYVRIVDFSQAQAGNSVLSLDTYVRETCESKWSALIRRALDSGQALVLLDGLDEVINAHQRKGVAEGIQKLVADYPGNAFLVASRIVGYQAVRLSGDFAHYTVQPLPSERIAEFVGKWYTAIEREAGESEITEEARQRAEELGHTIQQRPGIRRLAENPLLLTIIALVNWRGRKLPNRRVELYAHAAETLIESWPYQRAGVRLETERVIRLLSPVAYQIFATHSSGDITEDKLLPILTNAICRVDGVGKQIAMDHAAEMLGQVNEHSGIFRERAYDERGRRVFGFLHLTFAEYFTARYLAGLWEELDNEAERRALLRQYAHVPRWREVILLMAGDVGMRDNDSFRRATRLLGDILTLGSDYENWLHRDLLLAGECLADDLRVQPKAARHTLDRLAKMVLEPGANEIVSQAVFRSMRGTSYGQTVASDLLDRLTTDDKWERWATALALGALESDHAFNLLFALLQDEEMEIRRRAAFGLGKLGDGRAVEPLIAALMDSASDVRARAAWALGLIGDRRAIAPLQTLCNDESRWVRLRAMEALERLGYAHKIEELLIALQVGLGVDGEATDVAWRTRMADRLEAINHSIEKMEVQALIARLNSESEDVRWITAEALGVLGDARAVGPLIARLSDSAAWVRTSSAWALGEIGDAQALEPLRIRLEQDGEDVVRISAAWSLGKLGDARAVAPLIARLEDKALEVRRGAIGGLGRLGDARAIEPLLKKLEDASQRVQAIAYTSLISILNRNAPEPEGAPCAPLTECGPWDD